MQMKDMFQKLETNNVSVASSTASKSKPSVPAVHLKPNIGKENEITPVKEGIPAGKQLARTPNILRTSSTTPQSEAGSSTPKTPEVVTLDEAKKRNTIPSGVQLPRTPHVGQSLADETEGVDEDYQREIEILKEPIEEEDIVEVNADGTDKPKETSKTDSPSVVKELINNADSPHASVIKRYVVVSKADKPAESQAKIIQLEVVKPKEPRKTPDSNKTNTPKNVRYIARLNSEQIEAYQSPSSNIVITPVKVPEVIYLEDEAAPSTAKKVVKPPTKKAVKPPAKKAGKTLAKPPAKNTPEKSIVRLVNQPCLFEIPEKKTDKEDKNEKEVEVEEPVFEDSSQNEIPLAKSSTSTNVTTASKVPPPPSKTVQLLASAKTTPLPKPVTSNVVKTTPLPAPPLVKDRRSFQGSFESFLTNECPSAIASNVRPELSQEVEIESPKTFEEFVAFQLQKDQRKKQIARLQEVIDKPEDALEIKEISPKTTAAEETVKKKRGRKKSKQSLAEKMALSPITPFKRKPIKDFIDDDFEDRDWAVDQEEDEVDDPAPVVRKEPTTPKRRAASKSQQFIKEMAQSLAEEDYEEQDVESEPEANPETAEEDHQEDSPTKVDFEKEPLRLEDDDDEEEPLVSKKVKKGRGRPKKCDSDGRDASVYSVIQGDAPDLTKSAKKRRYVKPNSKRLVLKSRTDGGSVTPTKPESGLLKNDAVVTASDKKIIRKRRGRTKAAPDYQPYENPAVAARHSIVNQPQDDQGVETGTTTSRKRPGRRKKTQPEVTNDTQGDETLTRKRSVRSKPAEPAPEVSARTDETVARKRSNRTKKSDQADETLTKKRSKSSKKGQPEVDETMKADETITKKRMSRRKPEPAIETV